MKNLRLFLQALLNSGRDLLPIVCVISFFQLVILPWEYLPSFAQFVDIVIGLVMVMVGLTLFIRGLEMGLFPLGESMAYAFARKGSVVWLMAFAFALGFGTTVAEPALIAVANEAAKVAAAGGIIASDSVAVQQYAFELRFVVALSVGCAIVLGVLRILRGWSLHFLIIWGYLGVMLLTPFAPMAIIGVAYDSGGVTTSTVTVPMVTALGVGLATSIKGRNPMLDGFGMIALASLLPIVFVLLFGLWKFA